MVADLVCSERDWTEAGRVEDEDEEEDEEERSTRRDAKSEGVGRMFRWGGEEEIFISRPCFGVLACLLPFALAPLLPSY